jgi:hypothetical protein
MLAGNIQLYIYDYLSISLYKITYEFQNLHKYADILESTQYDFLYQ